MAERYKVTCNDGSNYIVSDIGNGMCEIHCLVTEHKEIVEHPQAWFSKYNKKIDQIRAAEEATI